VVERDPAEASGERRVLNLGHTLGHALEAALGYRGLRHGEAVAYGLLFALRLARSRGLDPAVAARARALLARLDLPPLPAADPALEPDALLAFIRRDKKADAGGIAWVLPTALGRWEVTREIGEDALRRELAAFPADPWP
jgi:3-dehydroquinate synthase